MSRSYKKHCWCTDGSPRSTKESKKFANKAVRHTDLEELSNGSNYKKHFCSYDIHDYKNRCTREEWEADWYDIESMGNYYRNRYSYEEYMKKWEKIYRRK